MNGFSFGSGVTGAPVLVDPPAWFECRVVETLFRGDHTIFVGEVVAAGVRRNEEPLTLRKAGFAYGGRCLQGGTVEREQPARLLARGSQRVGAAREADGGLFERQRKTLP